MHGFFSRQIDGAADRQGVKLGEFTKSYVVKLLAEYAHASTLHPQSNEPDTLALLYLKSQRAPADERVRMLKRLGDLALCISGFFADSLNRKVVDVDYYINMGGGAYGSLASFFEHKREGAVFSELYDELARKFPTLVDLLNDVAEGQNGEQQTMLRLYDRWLKTGSDRLRHLLCEKGLVPNATVKRTFQ